MDNYDSIDKALNTTNAIDVSTTPEGGCAKRKDQIRNVSDDIDKLEEKFPNKDGISFNDIGGSETGPGGRIR